MQRPFCWILFLYHGIFPLSTEEDHRSYCSHAAILPTPSLKEEWRPKAPEMFWKMSEGGSGWMVGSGKSLTGVGKIIYVSLASTKRCFWGTWVLTDEIQAAKWRILVLSTGRSSWRTQARVLNSALRALETFMCAYQLFLKLFLESKVVRSYLWKCDVYLCLEELWRSSLWAWWSRVAAVAVNSCELTHRVMAGFGEPLWQCLAVRGGISICRKEWLGVAGEWREKAVVVPSKSSHQVSYFLSSPSKDAPCWHMCFHLHCSMFARGQLLL